VQRKFKSRASGAMDPDCELQDPDAPHDQSDNATMPIKGDAWL